MEAQLANDDSHLAVYKVDIFLVIFLKKENVDCTRSTFLGLFKRKSMCIVQGRHFIVKSTCYLNDSVVNQ